MDFTNVEIMEDSSTGSKKTWFSPRLPKTEVHGYNAQCLLTNLPFEVTEMSDEVQGYEEALPCTNLIKVS